MKIILTFVLSLTALSEFCHAGDKLCTDLNKKKFPFELLKKGEPFKMDSYQTMTPALKCKTVRLEKVDDKNVEGYIGNSTTGPMKYTKTNDTHYKKTVGTSTEDLMCLGNTGKNDNNFAACFYSCEGDCLKSLNCYVRSKEGSVEVDRWICDLKSKLNCFSKLTIERCENLAKTVADTCPTNI